MQISLLPCYLVPLWPKYSPQHSYFPSPSAFVPPSMWKTKFHSHKKTRGRIVVHIHKHYVNEISFASQQMLTWWRREYFEFMSDEFNQHVFRNNKFFTPQRKPTIIIQIEIRNCNCVACESRLWVLFEILCFSRDEVEGNLIHFLS